jgi:hypothetical protein
MKNIKEILVCHVRGRTVATCGGAGAQRRWWLVLHPEGVGRRWGRLRHVVARTGVSVLNFLERVEGDGLRVQTPWEFRNSRDYVLCDAIDYKKTSFCLIHGAEVGN